MPARCRLLSAILLTVLCSSLNAADPRDPAYQAAKIYVGRDQDIPIGKGYLLAIQPRVSATGELIVPTSIIEALREIERALPHWFLNALASSAGDQECSVTVNNVGYNGAVTDWIWVNWVKRGSPIENEFKRLGAANSLSAQNALTVGLCELVKTNDEKFTMEYVAQLAKFALVQ